MYDALINVNAAWIAIDDLYKLSKLSNETNSLYNLLDLLKFLFSLFFCIVFSLDKIE